MQLSKAQLKVASAIFANLAAAWIFAMLLTRSIIAFLINLFYAIFAILITIQLEKALEEKNYD